MKWKLNDPRSRNSYIFQRWFTLTFYFLLQFLKMYYVNISMKPLLHLNLYSISIYNIIIFCILIELKIKQ